MHSVKIEDALYDKLASYCKENGKKIPSFCNDAIRKALNQEMYGDAPFIIKAPFKTDEANENGTMYSQDVIEKAISQFNENRQIYPETPLDFDKNTELNGKQENISTKIAEIKHETDEEIKTESRPKKRRL